MNGFVIWLLLTSYGLKQKIKDKYYHSESVDHDKTDTLCSQWHINFWCMNKSCMYNILPFSAHYFFLLKLYIFYNVISKFVLINAFYLQ